MKDMLMSSRSKNKRYKRKATFEDFDGNFVQYVYWVMFRDRINKKFIIFLSVWIWIVIFEKEYEKRIRKWNNGARYYGTWYKIIREWRKRNEN